MIVAFERPEYWKKTKLELVRSYYETLPENSDLEMRKNFQVKYMYICWAKKVKGKVQNPYVPEPK